MGAPSASTIARPRQMTKHPHTIRDIFWRAALRAATAPRSGALQGGYAASCARSSRYSRADGDLASPFGDALVDPVVELADRRRPVVVRQHARAAGQRQALALVRIVEHAGDGGDEFR